MKNIEKYEKELKNYGVYFALTKEGKLVSCNGIFCPNCSFYNCCSIKRMNWLLEEYKEPLLTEEEKQILHNILKVDEVLNGGIIAIAKKRRYSSHGEQYYFSFSYANDNVSSFNFNGNEMFKGLKLNKEYTIKELEL